MKNVLSEIIPQEVEYSIIEAKCVEQRYDVYKLWYAVYCHEMKRNLDYADHTNKIITDTLEPNSYIIIAKINNKIVGTFRIKFPEDGKISYYNDLYELDNFKNTSIGFGTRYMIHSDYRGQYISHILMEKTISFLRSLNKKYLIIDCSPAVYKLFEKLGFTDYLGEKISKEYGVVKIMKYEIR